MVMTPADNLKSEAMTSDIYAQAPAFIILVTQLPFIVSSHQLRY
jgi:hypothetical protein